MNELIYGRHAVYHLLASGRRRVFSLYLQEGKEEESPALLDLAKEKKIQVHFREPPFFSKKLGSTAAHHQGILVETEGYPYVEFESLCEESVLLVLDEIQDPQNLGALCRSAYLFGVGGVVLSETRSASVGPGACQAAVGSVEYLRISRVSSIAKSLELLKENGFWVYGADAEAAKSVDEETFSQKTALVIGSEEKGLKKLVRERCDLLLKIPTAGKKIASLNASAAGAIFLYEIFRQKLRKE